MLNGIRHAAEIASMALELLSHMVVFRVRHLPEHQLQLRIGIHTGKALIVPLSLNLPPPLPRVDERVLGPIYHEEDRCFIHLKMQPKAALNSQ